MKSKYMLVTCVAIFIGLMSYMFFWYGNNTTGIFIISIPAISLLISTCCYLANRNQDLNSSDEPRDEMYIGIGDETTSGLPPPPDHPPSYRMTWRRSFLRRWKHYRDTAGFSEAELTTINIPSSVNNATTQNLSPENNERYNGDTEASEISPLQINATEERNKKRKTSSKEEVRKDSVLKPQNSLPTYDEALEIIRSQNDLAKEEPPI